MQNTNSHTELDELLSRYYKGMTTTVEEQRLRVLLAADDSRVHDADRAVLGLMVARKKAQASAKKPTRIAWYGWGAAACAACVAVAFMLSQKSDVGGRSIASNDNYCEAYINGKHITDKEAVDDALMEVMAIMIQPNDRISN